MDDKEYINSKVYLAVANKHSVSYRVVEDINSFVGLMISNTIVEDDPNTSIKLDYLGNFFSKPGRRKAVAENKRKKDGLTNGSGQ